MYFKCSYLLVCSKCYYPFGHFYMNFLIRKPRLILQKNLLVNGTSYNEFWRKLKVGDVSDWLWKILMVTGVRVRKVDRKECGRITVNKGIIGKSLCY